ncbi:MAG: hypothetical protein MRY83_23190, partial [Flavobacteriales bacterium]|nr:hypothetical protein [Flavobacteriales bacterium]
VVKWTDKTTTAKIYDAKTGDLIKDLDLRSFMEGVDSRIISSKRLKNGDCVLAGFYGRFTEEKNEVAGIFKIVLNPDGDIIEKSSDTFLMTEIQSTQEKSSIEKIVITDSGNLFLVLGSKRLDKYIDVFEQLMVVGIKSDEIWTKSIPINHDMGNIVYSAYLDVEVHNSGEKIYIAYNDHPDNVKSYDYNNYKYSEKNKPAQYKNTVPSSCTILEIDQFGKVVPYSIDLNTAFTNLKESVLLENGKFFLTTNMYSVGGASKPKFVLVEL